MILKNLLLIGSNNPVNIRVAGNQIREVAENLTAEPAERSALKTDGLIARNADLSSDAKDLTLTFEDALAFPGLINSHDHLDFNLFPMLGDRTYNNYTEWGKYIHEHYKEEIFKVLMVPPSLREQWGMYKNLLCGVTTVLNHGKDLLIKERLITVHEQYQCLHSVKFEKGWKRKLNHPFRLRKPVVIHTGEGTDAAAALEIDELLRWNLLGKQLVGVHGVAMFADQAKNFMALVWCPESNFFLLNQTADIADLKKETDILFGTDSTLTGNWNIWDHLRLARKTGGLTDTELYQSLNVIASKVWGTKSGFIVPGYTADLVVADVKGKQADMDAFFSVDPKDILLVLQQGQIRLFDARCLPQLAGLELTGFSKVYIEGVCKYVQGDLPGLMDKIRSYYPEAVFPVRASL